MIKAIFLVNCLVYLWKTTDAIQCFSCVSNENDGKFCRRISEAKLETCKEDSTFCSALVFLKNGRVNVNRGCAGTVKSWGFGQTECDIMSSEKLMNMGVAFYQCRGDACNNIEPADDSAPAEDTSVVLVTNSVENAVKDDFIDEDDGYGINKVPTTRKKIDYGTDDEPTTKPKKIDYGTDEEQTTKSKKKKWLTTTPTTTETTNAETESPAYQEKKTKPPTKRTVAPYGEEDTTEKKIVVPITTEAPEEVTIKVTKKKIVTTTTQASEETEAPAYQEKVTKPTTILTEAPTRNTIEYGKEDTTTKKAHNKRIRTTTTAAPTTPTTEASITTTTKAPTTKTTTTTTEETDSPAYQEKTTKAPKRTKPATKKPVGYGEDETTTQKVTEKKIMTTTTTEETEPPAYPVKTKRTTLPPTTTKHRPEYGIDILPDTVKEITVTRPPRRSRTAFDRR